MTRPLTVPSFTALVVLFPDCPKLTYVKQQNVALPLTPNVFVEQPLALPGSAYQDKPKTKTDRRRIFFSSSIRWFLFWFNL